MVRDDLSTNLIHLTRGETAELAAEAFIAILESQDLRGSTRDIRGGYKCVCFTEAPLSKLATILAAAAHMPMRYGAFGVMVSKQWLFALGGRPVIYQTEPEFELLHERQRFRHVRYEPGATDYSWEREWRIQTEGVKLDPERVTLVVPNRAWERWALTRYARSARLTNIALSGFGPSTVFPWYVAVLEDIGVNIPTVPPPPL